MNVFRPAECTSLEILRDIFLWKGGGAVEKIKALSGVQSTRMGDLEGARISVF